MSAQEKDLRSCPHHAIAWRGGRRDGWRDDGAMDGAMDPREECHHSVLTLQQTYFASPAVCRSAIAWAVAYARQWEILSRMSPMRSFCMWSLAPPQTWTCGLPSGVLRTSISVQLMPPRQPVPRHFKIASLAAQRPAKCSTACLRAWQ